MKKPERIAYEDRIEYCLNGRFHREDGPALDYKDGRKCWYIEGKRHRKGGPAIVRADGAKIWFLKGIVHREDGPACIWPDGSGEYWLHGKRASPLEILAMQASD